MLAIGRALIGEHETQPVGVLFLDLDRFKAINDTSAIAAVTISCGSSPTASSDASRATA